MVPDSATTKSNAEAELNRFLSKGEVVSADDDLLVDIQQEYKADDKVGPTIRDKLQHFRTNKNCIAEYGIAKMLTQIFGPDWSPTIDHGT